MSCISLFPGYLAKFQNFSRPWKGILKFPDFSNPFQDRGALLTLIYVQATSGYEVLTCSQHCDNF